MRLWHDRGSWDSGLTFAASHLGSGGSCRRKSGISCDESIRTTDGTRPVRTTEQAYSEANHNHFPDLRSAGVFGNPALMGMAHILVKTPMDKLSDLTELSDEQLAVDLRIGMRRLAFAFLLQQEYFGTAAMMVAEFIATIQRLEAAESSGLLSVPSVKQAAILWRNEIRGLSLHDGRSAVAMVLGTNLVSDLGVLKILEDGTWPHAEMGDSSKMHPRDSCVLVGYPRTRMGREPWVFKTQIIKPTQTNARRDDWNDTLWTSGYPESIGGASGGGVFDNQGRVIAVLLGGSGMEMDHSRIELFRKNWSVLTANTPVEVVDAKRIAETFDFLNRVADDLATD